MRSARENIEQAVCALLLVLAAALLLPRCERTLDTAVQLDARTQVQETAKVVEREREKTATTVTITEAPTVTTEVGAWDELVFAPDPPETVAGNLVVSVPRVPRVVHHPATKVTVEGERKLVAEAKATEVRATTVEAKANVDAKVEAKKSEERSTQVGPPWWVWVLGVVLGVGCLFTIKKYLWSK